MDWKAGIEIMARGARGGGDHSDYIETKIQTALDLLASDENIADAVGPEVAASFTAMADNYIIPNVRHGVVTLTPAQQRSSAYVIMAAEFGDTLKISSDLATFTDRQRSAVHESYATMGAAPHVIDAFLDSRERQIAERANARPHTVHVTATAKVSGLTHVAQRGTGVDEALVTFTRPYAIYTFPHPDYEPMGSDSLVHEHMHQEEISDNPLALFTPSRYGLQKLGLMHEVEPVNVHAAIMHAKKKSGYPLSVLDRARIDAPAMIAGILANVDDETQDARQLFNQAFHKRCIQIRDEQDEPDAA